MPRLRRADTGAPGISRVRAGKGFRYKDPGGVKVGEVARSRIEALAIPPAWKDVWICDDELGHIQATGIDDAGRKQYLYHPQWRSGRDRDKFEEMLEFAADLPRLRRRVSRDLKESGMTRDRVLACAVRLLDHGFFRIGSERYADENETYGLATLRRKHVSFEGRAAVFDYRAKGAKRHLREVTDKEVIKLLRSLKNRTGGGHELLAFKRGGEWVDVKSADVNQYLKEVSGGDYSAKDFRTWNATVLMAVALAVSAEAEPAETDGARRRRVNAGVKRVAEYLSNTPAVCRRAYIDPRVIDRFNAGEVISLEGVNPGVDPGEQKRRGVLERRVADLIS